MEPEAEELYLFLIEEVTRMTKVDAGTGQTEILSRYLDKDDFLDRYIRRDGSEEDCRLCP